MKVIDNIEIIAKRDKVTYATNVSGKWRDYSIETEHGKRVKETFEALKNVEDEATRRKAAENLRDMLTCDIFCVPSVEEMNAVVNATERFVVTAGINSRTGRQLFLSTYEDCDEFHISVVPSAMDKQRCEYMIQVAIEGLKNKAAKSKLHIEVKIPDFQLVPVTELPRLLSLGL